MPVMYLPISMENEKIKKEQEAYADALIADGWDLEPYAVDLKDATGEATKFIVLKKDWDW